MANLSNINNKFLVTTGGNVLIGQTSAVGSSILQVTGASTFAGNVTISGTGINTISTNSTATFTIESSGVNGNNVYLALKSSDTEWRWTTNRGDQISGNQGDLFLRENTEGFNALIFETNTGNSTFAGDVTTVGNVVVGSSITLAASNGRVTATQGIFGSAFALTSNGYATFGSTSSSVPIAFAIDGDGSSPEMFIKTDGNVGIGTALPTANLNVVGPGDANDPVVAIDVTNSNAFNHGLEIFDANLTDGETVLMAIGKAGSTKNTAIFGYIHDADGGNDNLATIGFWGADNKMTVSAGGNVGIGTGTTTPGYKLDVSNEIRIVGGLNITAQTGTLYATDGALSYYAAGNGVYLNGAGASGWLRLQASGVENDQNSINIYGSASAYMTFRTANSTRMIINSSGNVGIGTTSPNSRLEVATSTNIGTYSDGAIQVVSNSPIAFVGASNLNPSLNRWGFKIREVADGDFNIHDYRHGATRMRITEAGNVVKPKSCAFSASTTTPGFLVTTSDSKITYNTENVDTNGNYDTTLSRFTAPVTGNYLIGTTNTCHISSVVTQYMAIYIVKNGSGTSYRFRGGGVDNDVNDWFGINGSVIIPLAQGDYIELFGYTNSGSYQIVNTEGHFYGYLIG